MKRNKRGRKKKWYHFDIIQCKREESSYRPRGLYTKNLIVGWARRGERREERGGIHEGRVLRCEREERNRTGRLPISRETGMMLTEINVLVRNQMENWKEEKREAREGKRERGGGWGGGGVETKEMYACLLDLHQRLHYQLQIWIGTTTLPSSQITCKEARRGYAKEKEVIKRGEERGRGSKTLLAMKADGIRSMSSSVCMLGDYFLFHRVCFSVWKMWGRERGEGMGEEIGEDRGEGRFTIPYQKELMKFGKLAGLMDSVGSL